MATKNKIFKPPTSSSTANRLQTALDLLLEHLIKTRRNAPSPDEAQAKIKPKQATTAEDKALQDNAVPAKDEG